MFTPGSDVFARSSPFRRRAVFTPETPVRKLVPQCLIRQGGHQTPSQEYADLIWTGQLEDWQRDLVYICELLFQGYNPHALGTATEVITFRILPALQEPGFGRRCALTAVAVLAVEEVTAEVIAGVGVVPRLLQILNNEVAELQILAVFALNELAIHNSSRAIVMNEGAIEALTRFLLEFDAMGKVQPSALQYLCVSVLANVSLNVIGAESVVENNALPLVADLCVSRVVIIHVPCLMSALRMKSPHRIRANLGGVAARCLTNVGTTSDTLKRRVQNEGAAEKFHVLGWGTSEEAVKIVAHEALQMFDEDSLQQLRDNLSSMGHFTKGVPEGTFYGNHAHHDLRGELLYDAGDHFQDEKDFDRFRSIR